MAKSKRKVGEVNASSMADIAFLLLCFFMMVSTMNTDTGLGRMLPPPVPKELQKDTPPIRERNVFEVLINSQNQLLVEGAPMQLRDLKDAAKNFIANPLNLETMPEKEAKEFPVVGVIQVTPKATISLQNDRDTQYQTYLAVQNELQRAYNELRDELSIRVFGSPYNDISTEEQDIVRSVYPQRISEAEPRNVGGGK